MMWCHTRYVFQNETVTSLPPPIYDVTVSQCHSFKMKQWSAGLADLGRAASPGMTI